MGCGQSKIHLYPRKSKSKANGKKSGNVDMVDADAEEDDEGHGEAEKELNGIGQQHHLRNEDDDNGLSAENDGKGGAGGDESALNGEITMPMLRGKNLSLLQNQDISSSQQNFFRMLDQKIDEGADYDSTSETEIALEEARLNALVQHWESASITASLCSSASRSLQSTPIRQPNPQPMRMQSMNSNVTMSPKQRDQRVLPQALMQQGYNVSMMGGGVVVGPGTPPQPLSLQHQQMLQQQQQQMAAAMQQHPQYALPPPPTDHYSQQRPFGYGAVGIPVGYYSQHPSMMHPQQLAYSTGLPIPQTNPNQVPSNYYGDLMQHQIQVAPSQQPLNPMMGYSPLITGGMGVMGGGGGGMSMDGTMVAVQGENKVFPAAISVQRLAPQVQRQIREIKDSCPPGLYGSPGPPGLPLVQGTGPPPPPQRMSTLRKPPTNNQMTGAAQGAVANNNSFETHSQEYS